MRIQYTIKKHKSEEPRPPENPSSIKDPVKRLCSIALPKVSPTLITERRAR
jgi:hypothetical protein